MGDSSSSLLSILPGLVQGLGGISLINQGAQVESAAAGLSAQAATQAASYASALALQGSQISANAYKAAATEAQAQTQYDIQVQNFNFQRQQDSFAKQIDTTFSHNMAIQGASGLSFTSQSYQAVTHSIASQNEFALVQMRNSEVVAEQQTAYQGQLYATAFTNQAIAATYEGEVQSQSDIYTGQVNATAADYRAQIAQYNADSQESSAIGGLFKSAFSAFSSM